MLVERLAESRVVVITAVSLSQAPRLGQSMSARLASTRQVDSLRLGMVVRLTIPERWVPHIGGPNRLRSRGESGLAVVAFSPSIAAARGLET